MQRGTARQPNATDAGRSSHPLHGSGGAVLLQLESLALHQAAQQATRMARQLPAPMCCYSSCLQVGLFPSRQAAQHAIAPAMKQQRQWFDKLRAELAPPAGKGSKKGQGGGSGLLSSERLTLSTSDRCRSSAGGCTCHASLQYCPPGLPRGVGLPNAAASTLHSVHRGPARAQALHTSLSAHTTARLCTLGTALKLHHAVSCASHSSCPTQGHAGHCLLSCRPWPLQCAQHRAARCCSAALQTFASGLCAAGSHQSCSIGHCWP